MSACNHKHITLAAAYPYQLILVRYGRVSPPRLVQAALGALEPVNALWPNTLPPMMTRATMYLALQRGLGGEFDNLGGHLALTI